MTDYHWTPKNQREFIECLSETGSITEACAAVNMSRRAAYNLRHRACGFGFRIGWDAAVLLSRCVVEGVLMDRVIHGQWSETVKDPDSGKTRRLNHDRTLGLGLLSRLDKMVDFLANEDSQHMAAQMAAQDFEVFLDLVERGAAANDMRAFLDARQANWGSGRDLRHDADFDRVPVAPDAQVDAHVEVKSAAKTEPQTVAVEDQQVREAEIPPEPETEIACELAQNCAVPADPVPGFHPFNRLPTNTPCPGEPGYGKWLMNQPWARM